MRTHLMARIAVVGLLLALPAGGQAGPVSYSYTLIAETSSGEALFAPSLNAAGEVAFSGFFQVVPGGFRSRVFVGSGGPLTHIGDTTNNPSTPLSLNDRGTVAFADVSFFTGGIFTGNGGPVTTIADTSGPFRFFGDPGNVNEASIALNNAGAVAFVALLQTGDRASSPAMAGW